MDADSPIRPIIFTPSTRNAFLPYLQNNPNTRRVTKVEKSKLIEWLTNPNLRPSSQNEFSRRNYVRKKFTWDEVRKTLFATAKKGEEKDRIVVTEDEIVDMVEQVHLDNGHAGWDATWKDVSSSYYGILRADVIFLLKLCDECASNPRKRSKKPLTSNCQVEEYSVSSLLSFDDILCESESLDGWRKEAQHDV